MLFTDSQIFLPIYKITFTKAQEFQQTPTANMVFAQPAVNDPLASLTPYQLLGVGPTASAQEIDQAYITLIRNFHPNRNPNGEAMAKMLKNCYDMLSDPRLRADYDGRRSADTIDERSPDNLVHEPVPRGPMMEEHNVAIHVNESVHKEKCSWIYGKACGLINWIYSLVIGNNGSSLTFYQLLGVGPTASPQEIKQAYTKQISYFHPDHNPNGDAMAKVLNKCYKTLSDPRLRYIYDFRGVIEAEKRSADNWVWYPAPKIVYPSLSTVLERCGPQMQEVLRDMILLTEHKSKMTKADKEKLILLRRTAEDHAQEHIVDAFGKALTVDFKCSNPKCSRRKSGLDLELDGICYCPKAAQKCHCNAEGCCPTKERDTF